MIRVLLVDDLPDVRNIIRLRIALEPDMEVVGEAENSAKALSLATELQPDLVIMDLKMTLRNEPYEFSIGSFNRPAYIGAK